MGGRHRATERIGCGVGAREQRRLGDEPRELLEIAVGGQRALDRAERPFGVAEQIERELGEGDGDARPLGAVDLLGEGGAGAGEAHLHDLALVGHELEQLARGVGEVRERRVVGRDDDGPEEHVEALAGPLFAAAGDVRRA